MLSIIQVLSVRYVMASMLGPLMTVKFLDQYAEMSDDELVDLALRGELISEADTALTKELGKRSIRDLAPYRRRREAEKVRIRESANQYVEAKRQSILYQTRLLVKFIVSVCLLASAWGWFGVGNHSGAITLVILAAVFPFLLYIQYRLRFFVLRLRFKTQLGDSADRSAPATQGHH
jgi:hypothetical protein